MESVIVVIYLLIHGACVALGILCLLKIDKRETRESTKPLYMRVQPLLWAVGLILGPAGIIIYLLINAIVPEEQKIWFQ